QKFDTNLDAELGKLELNGGIHGLSPFESLPGELTWKIIEFVPDMVFNLRLTSKVIKSLIDSYAQYLPTVPLLNKIMIRSTSDGVEIWMTFPEGKSNLFELCLKQRHILHEMTRHPIRLSHNPHINHYRLELESIPKEDFKRLGECFGMRIEEAMIYSGNLKPISVSSLLSGVKIERLEVIVDELNEEIANQLLQTVEVHEVTHLTLRMQAIEFYDRVSSLLIKLSSLVQSMHILQLEVEGIDCGRKYLLGGYDIDWSPTIVEMFKGKLNKLKIDSDYLGYLTLQGANYLKEKLPNLGAEIWFESNCNSYEHTFTHTVHDCIVEYEDNDFYLKIKHASRVNEPFREM
ncbi:hypothetical protein PMAYCL1PPCAC_19749, partial [Pristionchus mayeri]